MANNLITPLSRRSDFERLYKQGKRIRLSNGIVFVFKKNDVGQFRLGFSASSKYVNSVKRNKIKRKVREFFRNDQTVAHIDVLFIITRKISNENIKSDSFFYTIQKSCNQIVLSIS